MTSYNPIYYEQNREQKLAAQKKYQQSPKARRKLMQSSGDTMQSIKKK